MKIFDDETRQHRADLITARQNLDAVDDQHSECADECEDYLAANQAVIDAEERLPAWKRLDIEFGFYPERRHADEDVA